MWTFNQDPDERKRYTVDLTKWLDEGETVTAVEVEIDEDEVLVVEGYNADSAPDIAGDGLSYTFYVSAGTAGTTYKVILRATTSGGQIKEEVTKFKIKSN